MNDQAPNRAVQAMNRAVQAMNRISDDPISSFYFAKLSETILLNEVVFKNEPYMEVRIGDLFIDMHTVQEVILTLINAYAEHMETGESISPVNRFVFDVLQKIYPLSAVSEDYPEFINNYYKNRPDNGDDE